MKLMCPFNTTYMVFIEKLKDCFTDVAAIQNEYSVVKVLLKLDPSSLAIFNEIGSDLNKFAEDIFSQHDVLCLAGSDHPLFFDKIGITEIYPRLDQDEKSQFWALLANVVKNATTQRLLGSHGDFISKLINTSDLKGKSAKVGATQMIKRLISDPSLRNEALGLMGKSADGKQGFFGNVGDMMKGYGLTAAAAPCTTISEDSEEDDKEEEPENMPENKEDNLSLNASDMMKLDKKKKKQRRKKNVQTQNPMAQISDFIKQSEGKIDMSVIQKEMCDHIDSRPETQDAFLDLIANASMGGTDSAQQVPEQLAKMFLSQPAEKKDQQKEDPKKEKKDQHKDQDKDEKNEDQDMQKMQQVFKQFGQVLSKGGDQMISLNSQLQALTSLMQQEIVEDTVPEPPKDIPKDQEDDL